jgi:hypothetical protein
VVRERISTFVSRFIGYLRFDPAAYRAISTDPDGLIYAMVVVIVASAAAALGAAGPGIHPLAAIGPFFAELAQWAICVSIAYFLSITLFPQPKSASFMGVMPLLGLAQAPRALELLGVLPIPGLTMASMLAGIVLFFAYVIASLREAFGFDLRRAAVNGVAGLLASYALMSAAIASGGSRADALGFPNMFAGPPATPVATPLATPRATPVATPAATPRPFVQFATPHPPRPTRAPVVRHQRARAAALATPRAHAATPTTTPAARAGRATPKASQSGATPIAGKGGHARRKTAPAATPGASPVARVHRGRTATPAAEASPGA